MNLTLITENNTQECDFKTEWNDGTKLEPFQTTTIAHMRQMETDKTLVVRVPCNTMNTIKSRIRFSESQTVHKHCELLTVHSNIGILANKVGTGKSLIVIGLIQSGIHVEEYEPNAYIRKTCYNAMPTLPRAISDIIADYAQSYSFQAMTYSRPLKHNIFDTHACRRKPTDVYVRSSLIVVPHSLFRQWKNMLSRTNMKVKYIGSKRDIDFSKADIKSGYFDQFDAVLCNVNKLAGVYGATFVQFCSLWTTDNDEVVWSRVFVDEADTIDSRYIPYLRSHFIWLITATYDRLARPKNNHFIRYICDTLKTKIVPSGSEHSGCLLDAMTIKCGEKFINKYLPIPSLEYTYKCFKDNLLHTFFKHANVQGLNAALNSNDYMGAFYCIVARHEIYKLQFVVFDTQNKKKVKKLKQPVFGDAINKLIIFYFAKLLYQLIKAACLFSRTNRKKKKMNIVRRYRDIIDTFRYCESFILRNGLCIYCLAHYALSITEECFLCDACKAETGFISFNFKQIFAEYIKFANSLPSVLQRIAPPTVRKYPIDDIPKIMKSVDSDNEKVSYIINDLRRKADKRILVFTDNYYLINTLTRELIKSDIKFYVVKGNHNVINKRISDYNSKKTQVLLLNMKFFGSGLDLLCTDEIYIFNDMSEQTETQVIGRANRYGR